MRADAESSCTESGTRFLVPGCAYCNDNDWFAVTLEADVEYQFDIFTSIFGFGFSAANGAIVGIYDSNGTAQTIVTQNVGPSGGFQDRRAYFTPTAGGTYWPFA